MKLQDLEKKARKEQFWASRVQRWRSSDKLGDFFLYLYWRSRYPILTKLCSRAALFLEFYLLYLFFHRNIVASFGLFFLALLLAKGLFRGLAQYFRLAMIKAQQQKCWDKAGRQLALLLLISKIYGAAVPLLMLAAASFYGIDRLSLYYIAVWIILMPLQLMASGYWMAVYTSHRLRRSFWLVVFCRYLPSMSIILLANSLGPVSYLTGMLVGRGLEQLYLLRLARQEVINLGIIPQTCGRRQLLRLVIRDREFWAFSYFPFPFQLYALFLAIFIYCRDIEYWLTHFVFTFLVMTFSFLAYRVSQSVVMDIYLALRYSDIEKAAFIRRRARQALVMVLSVCVAVLMALFVIETAMFTVRGDVLYQLWLYFIAMIVVRSLFESEVAFQRAAAVQYRLNFLFSLAFILFMIPAQAVLIFYLRANLPLIYLFELSFLAALSLVLYSQRYFESSPVFLGALQQQLRDQHLLAPALWLQYFSAWRQSRLESSLMILQLDQRYQARGLRLPFLKELAGKVFRPSDVAFRLEKDFYVFLLPGLSSGEALRYRDKVLEKFAGHIRNCEIVDRDIPLVENIQKIWSFCSKVRQFDRSGQVLHSRIALMLKEQWLQKLEKELPFEKIEKGTKVELLEAAEELLNKYGYQDLPRVIFAQGRKTIKGRVNSKMDEFVARVSCGYHGQKMLIPLLRGSFVVLSVFGRPLMVLDASDLDSDQLNRLQIICFSFCCLLSFRIACSTRPAARLPLPLFELITAKLKVVCAEKGLGCSITKGRRRRPAGVSGLAADTSNGEIFFAVDGSK